MNKPKHSFVIIIVSIFIITTQSCTNNLKEGNTLSNRNSLLNEYLKVGDEIDLWRDTFDAQRVILTAFLRNDTSKLNSYLEHLRQIRKKLISNELFKTPAPKISSYNFTEGYQFEYHPAFCPYSYTITVGKKAEKYVIIAYEYSTRSFIEKIYNSNHTEIETEITQKTWDSTLHLLKKSDFWGLKSINDKSGFCGSTLYATGLKSINDQSKKKYSYIYRWSPEDTTLFEVFALLYRYSNLENYCLF